MKLSQGQILIAAYNVHRMLFSTQGGFWAFFCCYLFIFEMIITVSGDNIRINKCIPFTSIRAKIQRMC